MSKKSTTERISTTSYVPPTLTQRGSLATLIRGASWKGVDSVGEIDPDNAYPA